MPYGQWELYLYSTVDHANFATTLQVPAIETDIGIAPNLGLHFVIPYTFYLPQQAYLPQRGVRAAGFGDMELGFKYRFINSSNHRMDVAFAPIFEMPTGDPTRFLGNGRFWMQLPLWLEKKWGPWSSYGGGGYTINPSPRMRNYPFAGWVGQRELNKKITLGAELFWQGRSRINGKSFTIFDTGGYYYFKKDFGLLFSAGHSIIGERHAVGNLGLFWTG